MDWMMKNKVKPLHEEDLQDIDGNTVLHIFAMPNPTHLPPPLLSTSLRMDMCKILTDWGVSPLVQNKRGQLPIDCVEKKEKSIFDLLENAMKRG